MRTRRDVMKALAAAGAMLPFPAGAGRARAAGNADLAIRLVAAPGRAQIRAGENSGVLRFTAEVLRGRADAVRPSPTYLGPTLDFVRGERVRISFVNRSGEPSIVHWHGMLVPEHADGHPRFAIASEAEYVYEFQVQNPAGTYLYHPHPHGRTGPQVYAGLAGVLIVREPHEAAMALPAPEHELNLVVQDRRFVGDNRLVYRRMMMDDMTGVLGDEVLVNGVADAAYRVARRTYRLRIANVSNARIYKLAWSDERPLRVVAADNGLFDRDEGVQTRPYVVLAPFERVELLEDFGARAGGAEVALVSREFADDAMGGMMGSMMGGGMMGGTMGRRGSGMMGGMMGSGQGEAMRIARFAVAREARTPAAPVQLPRAEPRIGSGRHELHTQLSFRHMRGSLNGRVFDQRDMTAVAEDERLPLGQATVWTFANDGPGMGMPHPVHVHGVRFRVLERAGARPPADLREGLIDTGYKDTVLVFPGERVRLVLAPTEPGLFMYHCHNLEHEDGGMMRNCRFG